MELRVTGCRLLVTAMAGNRNKNIFVITTEKPQKFVMLKDNQPANRARFMPWYGLNDMTIKPSRTK